jgi:Xaa-Pro dipeptidase
MDLKEVIGAMHSQEIDSLIIFKPENITYLTGFKPSSSSILILKDDAVLFTSKMEMNNALNQSKVQVEELKSLNEVKKNL